MLGSSWSSMALQTCAYWFLRIGCDQQAVIGLSFSTNSFEPSLTSMLG